MMCEIDAVWLPVDIEPLHPAAMMPGREGPPMFLLTCFGLLLVALAEVAFAWVHPLAALPYLVILSVVTSVMLVATIAAWLPPPTEVDPGPGRCARPGQNVKLLNWWCRQAASRTA
jgi:hypothetical protein